MSRDETREEAKGDYQSRKGSLLRLEPMMSSLARLLIYQKSEYLSCLPDMVPGGELEHGAECDKGVNVSNTEEGGLAGDVQNRDQRGGENTRPKKNSQLVRAKDCR